MASANHIDHVRKTAFNPRPLGQPTTRRFTSLWKRYEIGTYTGYSALAVALAMEAGGRVVTCEIDEAIATTAKCHWRHVLAYYERCHALVRVGGVILIDNTLWDGSVADDAEHDPSTEAIRAFNNFVHEDQRVEMVLLPIGDGLTLVRKIA